MLFVSHFYESWTKHSGLQEQFTLTCFNVSTVILMIFMIPFDLPYGVKCVVRTGGYGHILCQSLPQGVSCGLLFLCRVTLHPPPSHTHTMRGIVLDGTHDFEAADLKQRPVFSSCLFIPDCWEIYWVHVKILSRIIWQRGIYKYSFIAENEVGVGLSNYWFSDSAKRDVFRSLSFCRLR